MLKHWQVILLVLLVSCAIGIRCYHLSASPYDLHSFRQAQTLATIEDYYQNGIDLLHSKTNFVGFPGYLVLEFPLYQAMMAFFWTLTLPSIVIIRLYNILLGLLTTFLVYKIGQRWFDEKTAFVAGFLFLFVPLNIVYHRSVLPDITAVFFSFLAIYLFIVSVDLARLKKLAAQLFYLLLIVLIALLKPLYIFPLLVIFGFAVFLHRKVAYLFHFAVFAIAAIVMFFWLHHAAVINALSPFTANLTVQSHLGFSKVVQIEYWLIILYRVVNQIAVGPAFFLLLFSFVGLKSVDQRIRTNIMLCWTIILGYLVIFAKINFPHDYYQLILVPFFALLVAYAAVFLYQQLKIDKWIKTTLLVSVCLALVVSSVSAALVGMKNSRSVSLFARIVSESLDHKNEYVLIFGPPYWTTDIDRWFDNPAYLHSVAKKGLMFQAQDVNEAIGILSKKEQDLQSNFGEIVFYRLGLVSSAQENKMRQFGYSLKKRGPDFQIFQLFQLRK